MKHPELKKLLKRKILTALLADLEALSDANLALEAYDLEGQSFTGSATLSATEVKALLQVDDAAGLSSDAARTLVVHGKPVGLLVAANTGEDHSRLSPQLDAAANLLTHILTQAMGGRALVHETLECYREINLLYRIQEAIGARFDLAHIADLLLKESIRVIKAESGVLLTLRPDRSAFDVQAWHGQVPIQEHCPLTDTIAGWVVHHQQVAIVNDTADDPRCGPADKEARSLLCVPLITGAKNIGALTLYNKVANNIFTASNQKLLTALAFPVAIAIETTRETKAHENQLKAQIRKLRIQIDEILKESQVRSITATDYFTYLQETAQEMRREFEEGL